MLNMERVERIGILTSEFPAWELKRGDESEAGGIKGGGEKRERRIKREARATGEDELTPGLADGNRRYPY